MMVERRKGEGLYGHEEKLSVMNEKNSLDMEEGYQIETEE